LQPRQQKSLRILASVPNFRTKLARLRVFSAQIGVIFWCFFMTFVVTFMDALNYLQTDGAEF
jgi:hypothetical protein